MQIFKQKPLVVLVKRALFAIGCVAVVGTVVPVQSQTPLPPPPPPTRLPSLGEGSEMTISAERRLGDSIAREIYRDADYIDDPLLGEYVQGIWQPLLAAARARGELSPEMDERFAWTIMMGRDRSVNAFALPGGYFGLHLGLLAVVANRAELASVLGHEMTHVTQRHIARMISREGQQSPWLLGAMILGVLAASRNPEAASAIITGSQAASIAGQLSFSRDMEREADRVGYGVMTQAGFEPQGFVTMFEKLQKASQLNDSGGFPYLRSHPLTTARIADMQARQQLLAPGPPLRPMLDHVMLSARARVLSRPGIDTLRNWVAEADATNFASLPPVRQAAVLYAASLAAVQMRDSGAARALQKRLAPLTRTDAAAARLTQLLGAEIELAAGEPVRAAALLDPDAPGRPELLMLGQARLVMGQPAALADQAERLQNWVAVRPQDAGAWQQLGSVYGARGQAVRAIRAEAEAQVAMLDYGAAVDRFKAAQDLVRRTGANAQPGDHIEASIIDTRLRQVESKFREQAFER